MKKDYSLYCSYCPIVGWRVRAVTEHALPKVRVVQHKGMKLMRIPSIPLVKNGRFLNPKTNALSWVKESHNKEPVYGDITEHAFDEMLKTIIHETLYPVSLTCH